MANITKKEIKEPNGKVVIIKSYFSEDYDNLDGLYKVEVPQQYENTYKQVISEVGNVRDDMSNGFFYTIDDIDITENSIFKREDYEKIWDELDSSRDCGGSLCVTLDVLGWKWESINFESFDADYNEFK